MSFVYEVCKDYGFSYSMNTGRVLPKGVKWADVPPMAELEEDGSVSVYGETRLSKAQVKALIQEQKNYNCKADRQRTGLALLCLYDERCLRDGIRPDSSYSLLVRCVGHYKGEAGQRY